MPVFLKKSIGGDGWYKKVFPAISINVPKINKEQTANMGFKLFPYLVIRIDSKTAVVISKDPIMLNIEKGVSTALGNIICVITVVLRSNDTGNCKETKTVRTPKAPKAKREIIGLGLVSIF